MIVQAQTQSLSELQHYIVAEHHVYTRQAMETISLLAEKVANRHGGNHEEVLIVRSVFDELETELRQHLFKEEQILFPYVEEMEAVGTERPWSRFGTIADPIRVMLTEHETVGEKMLRIRRATSNYTLPADACLSFRALYERLADLENDLHKHVYLENTLLFPGVLALERR